MSLEDPSHSCSVLKSLNLKFICSVCKNRPTNPHMFSCKHSFCKECVVKNKSCPLCGNIVIEQDLVPDLMLTQLLNLINVADTITASGSIENQPSQIKGSKKSVRKCGPSKLEHNTSSTSKNLQPVMQTPKSKLNTTKTSVKQSNKLCSSVKKTPKCSNALNQLNKTNSKGETPLQIAARQGAILKVQDLLTKGANPNVKDYAGWTPLCDAVGSGKLEVVKALLEAGAGVNTPSHQNTTALVEAVVKKDENMIKLLMSYGADMDQRTSLNNTALSIADEHLKTLLLTCKGNDHTVQPYPRVTPCPQALLPIKLSQNDTEKVIELGRTLNLSLSTVFTEEVSHVIVEIGSDGMCEGMVEVMQGLLKGCSVVGMDWVNACLAHDTLLPVDGFQPTAILGQSAQQIFTKARINRECLLPRLFDGCHISLQQEQTWPAELRQRIKKLVTTAGAQFLPRACDAERIPLNEQTVMFHTSPPSPLAYTSHIVLYQSGPCEPQLKYNMVHIKTLSLDWFYRCIYSFSILPPDL